LTKKYDHGTSLNHKILEGVNILADTVACTLGPRGRNVILKEKDGRPIITKDGVTVAQFVNLEDPMQNAGAQIMKQASAETNNTAGDGTTTATVLARAILRQAQAHLTAGASPVELKRGMDKAVERIVWSLEEMSTPISKKEDIENIATISANGDKSIGQLIATAVDAIGKDGAITVEPARSLETSLEVAEGFKFGAGYVSTSFLTDQRRATVNYNDCYLLVTDFSITAVDDLLPVLEIVAREARPLVVIAENIEGQALAALIMNAMRGTLKVAAVKAPMYGEERRNMLKDIALSTGATFVNRQAGKRLKEVKLIDLGQCQSIEITKASTTIVGTTSDYEKVEEQIKQLKEELSATESISDCERIQERITRLASGVAIIRVGAATEIEMIEKKHRIEDALEAVKSAQMEGIVPGGGTALLRAAAKIEVEVDNEQQSLGVDIIKKAVSEPLRQMALNAGESPDLVLSMVLKESGDLGYNFATQKIENMIESGILDPAKVTRSALQNATSVASTLITTSHAIIEVN